jgi:Haspin like kinase domain
MAPPSRAPLTELSSQAHNQRKMAARQKTYSKHGRKVGAQVPLWSSPGTEDTLQENPEILAIPVPIAQLKQLGEPEHLNKIHDCQEGLTVNNVEPEPKKSDSKTPHDGLKNPATASLNLRSKPRKKNVDQNTLTDSLQSFTITSLIVESKPRAEKSSPNKKSTPAIEDPLCTPTARHPSRHTRAKTASQPENDPFLSALLEESTRPKVLSFSDFAKLLEQDFEIVKCAEGSFGDVYKTLMRSGVKTASTSRLEKLGGVIFKLIPVGPQRGEGSRNNSKVEDVVREVKMIEGLTALHGFTNFRGVHVLKGKYPQSFAEAFHVYRDQGGESWHKSPERAYKATQLFAAIEMTDAGTEFAFLSENINVFQLYDVFWSCVIILADAEEKVQFEARDMHVSNILIRPFTHGEAMNVREDDVRNWPKGQSARLGLTNIRVTLIDYNLSRATVNGNVMFNNLKGNRQLVPPGGAETLQQWTYTRQKQAIRDASGRGKEDWSLFVPKTNMAWLSYLLELHTEINSIKGSNEHCKAAQDAVRKKLEAAQDALESSLEDSALRLASAGEFLKLAMERMWVGEEEVKAYKERLESDD